MSLMTGVLACLLPTGASANDHATVLAQVTAENLPQLDALIRPSLGLIESATLPRSLVLDTKPVDLTARPDDLWQRIRQGFAIRNISSPQVPQRMSTLLSDPDRLRSMLERAGPYLYYIVEECERRGLPTELALLPFVESSFNPHATSPAGAAGLWQFIPSTGRVFKLKQDSVRDERRDVIASTQAALDYLSQLYDMYGDWYLALAAYNWGEGSVRRALEQNRKTQQGDDYLNLRMPDETRNYVPKLQAIKNIIDSPEAFSFSLPPIDNKPFFSTVARTKAIDVRTAAQLANMSLDEFKKLNPGFRSHIPAAGDLSLLIPTDKAELFENRLRLHAPGNQGKVGLKQGASQTSGFLSGGAGSESDSGLKDNSALGYFRPYAFKQPAQGPAIKRPAAPTPPAAPAVQAGKKPVSPKK